MACQTDRRKVVVMGFIMDNIMRATTCSYINKVGKRTYDWLEAEARKAEREEQERAAAEPVGADEMEQTDLEELGEICETGEENGKEESAAEDSLDIGQISYNLLASTWPLFAKLTPDIPIFAKQAANYKVMMDRE